MSEEQGGRRTVEVELRCVYEGFAFDLRADLAVAEIPRLVTRLVETGVTPGNSPYLWTGERNGQAPASDDAPRCRIHGRPMKESKKGGWFCPAKLANGSYCDEKS